jgi:hypothetical protein
MTVDSDIEIIKDEIHGRNMETVRREFLEHFQKEVDSFEELVMVAFERWERFDATINDKEQEAYISAYLFNVINQIIISMELLLSSHAVPSGNLMRQAIESVAMAILVSRGDMSYLKDVKEDKFKTAQAVNEVKQHLKDFHVNTSGWGIIEETRNFYHDFSHPSPMGISFLMSFHQSRTIMGAFFDPGKINEYEKEIKLKTSFANQIVALIDGIEDNMVLV